MPKRLPFFYGWVVVAVAFVTMAIGVNVRTGFSLLFPPILAEFGWNRAETAATFSIGFFASAVGSPWLGVAMDRFGPRRVVPAGAILVAAGLALATLATRPWHLYLTLGALTVGGTVIFSYIGHSMFLPNWFRRRRGLAIGIAFSGVGIGSMVLFPWMQAIIAASGWRAACWTLAALLVVLVLPLNYVLQRGRPEDLGLHPDGDPPPAQQSASGKESASTSRSAASLDWTLRRALTSASFWWIGIGYFCGLFVWYAVQVHQTKYLIDVGVPPQTAAFALGFVGLGSIVGQIGLGYLSDRIGRAWAWTIGALGFAACYGCLLVLGRDPSPLWVWSMVCAQGVVGYGLASVFGTLPAETFQGRSFGAILGILSLMSTLGAGVGPWVAGLSQDWTGSYGAAWWICIVLCFVSTACIWMSVWTRPNRQA